MAPTAGQGDPCRPGLRSGALAGLTSPVVGAFLSMALVAWAVADLGRAPTRQVSTELVAGDVNLGKHRGAPATFPWPRLFPLWLWGSRRGTSRFARCWRSPGVVSSQAGHGWSGPICRASSIAIFLLRTPVGDNDTRLAAYVGVPLAICYLPEAAHRLMVGPGGRLPQVGSDRSPCCHGGEHGRLALGTSI